MAALTSDKALDSTYMKAFIATYRSFATPWQLLEKLVQRYNVPKSMPLERGLPIKLRVSVVIKYWVESHFDDFEEELVKKLFDFCDNTLLPDKQTALAKQLREFLTNKVEQRKAKYQRVLDVPPTDLVIPSGSRSPSELFMALNDEEIARQLTLIDFQLFQIIEVLCDLRIQSRRCLTPPLALGVAKSGLEQGQAQVPRTQRDRAPHTPQPPLLLDPMPRPLAREAGRSCQVRVPFRYSSRTCYFFFVWIIYFERSMLAKLYRVAELLRKSNNFHTLMALVAGLNNASLQRLKSTKKLVGDQLLQSWAKIEKLMHPQVLFRVAFGVSWPL